MLLGVGNRSTPYRQVDVEACQLLGNSMWRLTSSRRLLRIALDRESLYRTIVERSAAGIARVDLNGAWIEVNPALCAMTGYSREELLCTTFQEITHPQDLDTDLALLDELIKGLRNSYQMEKRYFRKDGQILWVSLIVSCVRDEDGKPFYFIAMITDISEPKRSAEKLRLSQARLSGLIQSVDAGVVRHAPDTRILFSNPRAEELLGLPGPGMRGLSASDAVWKFVGRDGQPLDVSQFPVNQIVATQRPLRNFLLGIVRSDREAIVWVLVNGVPLFNEADEPSEVVIAFSDVTSLIESQDKLRIFSEVFARTAEGTMICDPQVNIREVNDAFVEITGFTRDEVLGKNPRILQSGRHDQDFYKEMWASLKATGDWSGEVWNRRKDGGIVPELLSISALDDETGNHAGYVGIFSDISALKKTSEKLEYLARHDPLTGLPNRLSLDMRLEAAINSAQRRGSSLAVIFLDIHRLAINIGGPQLINPLFADTLETILSKTGFNKDRLALEITERYFFREARQILPGLEGMAKAGFSMAIDDFGTGASSLSDLQRLPVDRLKVDQSFVRDLPGSERDRTIVEAVVALGHSLDMVIVAEGVETAEQCEFLRGIGCDEAQGFYFSKPLEAEDLPAYLKEAAK